MKWNIDKSHPICPQIFEQLCCFIANNKIHSKEKLFSVRELAVKLGVNPNTVMRSYEKLTNDGIIYNKRGIGYFISKDAKEIVLQTQRKEFLENELPVILRRMELLGINPEMLQISEK